MVFVIRDSNGCHVILWNFQGWSFILSGISKGKMINLSKNQGFSSNNYVLSASPPPPPPPAHVWIFLDLDFSGIDLYLKSIQNILSYSLKYAWRRSVWFCRASTNLHCRSICSVCWFKLLCYCSVFICSSSSKSALCFLLSSNIFC